MTRVREALRLLLVVTSVIFAACGSYLLVRVAGPAISEGARYLSWFFVFVCGVHVTLILRTYDVQNIEALSADKRRSVRHRVKSRVDGLWALFSMSLVGGLCALAAIVLKDPDGEIIAATLLVFFMVVSALGLVIVPGWYHQVEAFKSAIIEQERIRKERAELLKSMREAADDGYSVDPALESYNQVIEPNSHA